MSFDRGTPGDRLLVYMECIYIYMRNDDPGEGIGSSSRIVRIQFAGKGSHAVPNIS